MTKFDLQFGIKETKKQMKNFASKFSYIRHFDLSLFLVKTSLNLLAILLFVEFIKYPDLNYQKIYMYLIMGISGKLSWLILKK